MSKYLIFFVVFFGGLSCCVAQGKAGEPKSAGVEEKKSASREASKKGVEASGKEAECDLICQGWVARTLVDAAREFHAQGHTEIAVRYLRRVLTKYKQTSSAAAARGLVKIWGQESSLDLGGRIEFIVTSSLYGVGLGIATPLAFEAREQYVFGISIVGFTLLGLAGSIFGSLKWLLTAGQASSITIGTVWGTWNLAALSVLGRATGSVGTKLALLGSVLGYGGGLALGYFLKPTIGRITFASSLGMWLTIAGGLVLGIMSAERVSVTEQVAFSTLLVASDLGILTGLFLYPLTRFSRARSVLINIGGVAGGALGAGIALIGQPTNATPYLIAALVGGAVGLGLTTFVTGKMRPGSVSSRSTGVLVHLEGGRWSLDMPMPMLMPSRDGQGNWRPALQVPLAAGSW